jgi:hypothetical protein
MVTFVAVPMETPRSQGYVTPRAHPTRMLHRHRSVLSSRVCKASATVVGDGEGKVKVAKSLLWPTLRSHRRSGGCEAGGVSTADGGADRDN